MLPEEMRVEFAVDLTDIYPADIRHYRFMLDPNSGLLEFLIPVGVGTDGAFMKCYNCEIDPPRASWHSGDHLWNLFTLIYGKIAPERLRVMDNWQVQTAEWRQNLKDVIDYLEKVKGFTVYGKELFGV